MTIIVFCSLTDEPSTPIQLEHLEEQPTRSLASPNGHVGEPRSDAGTDTDDVGPILWCAKRFCGFNTYSDSEYVRHERQCGGTMTVQCALCKLFFPSMKQFSTHQQEAHKISEILLCAGPSCNFKTVVISEMDKHQEICHSNVRVQCPLCRQVFPSLRILRIHHKEDHAARSPEFSCLFENCEFTTTTRDLLEGHMSKHQEPIFCDICEERFSSKENMWVHQARFHSELKNVLKCIKCDFVTVDIVHFGTHQSQCVVFCNTCKAGFRSSEQVWAHQAQAHPHRVAVLSCTPPCDFVTVSRSHLEQHLAACPRAVAMTKRAANHSGSPHATNPMTKNRQRFRCVNKCGFETDVLPQLHQHEDRCRSEVEVQDHQDQDEESVFQCSLCSITLKSEEDMWIHLAREHGNIVGVLRCVGSCDFVTTEKSHLKEHAASCTEVLQYHRDVEAIRALTM